MNDIPVFKVDPRHPGEKYAVVGGPDLVALRDALNRAILAGRSVRFTVHNGMKWDAGTGWTPSMGRPANETGH